MEEIKKIEEDLKNLLHGIVELEEVDQHEDADLLKKEIKKIEEKIKKYKEKR